MSEQKKDKLYIFNDILSEETNKDLNSIKKELNKSLNLRKEPIEKKEPTEKKQVVELQVNTEQNKKKQVVELQTEQNKDIQETIKKKQVVELQVKTEQNKDIQVNEKQIIELQVNEKQIIELQVNEKQVIELQVNEEQNKDKQNEDEQVNEKQDIEEQDKDDNFLEIRKQRSRYYLWKLYQEYEQMRLNQRYRTINFIVNIIISLASIILGFFFWAIDHDPNIRNVIDFGKISLSFGGLGVITNIIGFLAKFMIKRNDDQKSDGNKNDNKNDNGKFILDRFEIEDHYLLWLDNLNTSDHCYLVYFNRRLLDSNFLKPDIEHNLRHSLYWLGEVYFILQIFIVWYDICEALSWNVKFRESKTTFRESKTKSSYNFFFRILENLWKNFMKPVIINFREKMLFKKMINGLYIESKFPLYLFESKGSTDPKKIFDPKEIFDFKKFDDILYLTNLNMLFRILSGAKKDSLQIELEETKNE
ncbi:35314_t:CDS:2 [Gigaspora margarita]|uniref:35314_t:CDS:1 n=1 Tax=Gigaspora margarita TaxID=4874 RepID=A0ABN7W441_GIGMA|nr:35314_t:CDS:2 [Gigaspora margarita]